MNRILMARSFEEFHIERNDEYLIFGFGKFHTNFNIEKWMNDYATIKWIYNYNNYFFIERFDR